MIVTLEISSAFIDKQSTRIISNDVDRLSKLMIRLRTEVTAYGAVKDASQVSRFISWSKGERGIPSVSF